jgi:predicted nucleic acid-binding Zn ribbon protein
MANSRPVERSSSVCPVCGADVPPNALACPECGADEKSGLNEEMTRYDGLDIPDEAFADDDGASYDAIRKDKKPTAISIVWWLIGVAVLLVTLYLVFRHQL